MEKRTSRDKYHPKKLNPNDLRMPVYSPRGHPSIGWRNDGAPVWAIGDEKSRFPGQPICGAPRANSQVEGHEKFGLICLSPFYSLYSNGRCKLHGGTYGDKAKKRATANALRYSTAVPGRLLSEYENAHARGELIDLRPEIALVEVRTNEVLKSLDRDGTPVATQGQLLEAWKKFEEAYGTEDTNSIAKSLETLSRLIRKGAAEYYTWRELWELVNIRRGLVQSQVDIMLKVGQALTIEQVRLYTLQLAIEIKKAIGEKLNSDVGEALLDVIADKIEYVMTGGASISGEVRLFLSGVQDGYSLQSG